VFRKMAVGLWCAGGADPPLADWAVRRNSLGRLVNPHAGPCAHRGDGGALPVPAGLLPDPPARPARPARRPLVYRPRASAR
jgi:hypothetical protein